MIIQQTLLRSVPARVTSQRFTFFNAQETVVHGPITRPKQSTIRFENVPVTTTRLQIEYLAGSEIVGLGGLPLNLDPAEELITSEPPFQDIIANLVSLELVSDTSTIPNGTSHQFSLFGTYSDDSRLNLTSSATWSSSNPAVAGVSPVGVVTGISEGTTVIAAQVSQMRTQVELTVSQPTLTSIDVTLSNPLLPEGLTQQFVATAHWTDGTTTDASGEVFWRSSQPVLAPIDSSGQAIGLEPGQTTISASWQNIVGEAVLTVSAANVQSLSISPTDAQIADGTSLQLLAQATLTDSSTRLVNETAVWTSTSPNVATVSSTGVVTGLSTGEATIRAALSGKMAEIGVTKSTPPSSPSRLNRETQLLPRAVLKT